MFVFENGGVTTVHLTASSTLTVAPAAPIAALSPHGLISILSSDSLTLDAAGTEDPNRGDTLFILWTCEMVSIKIIYFAHYKKKS